MVGGTGFTRLVSASVISLNFERNLSKTVPSGVRAVLQAAVTAAQLLFFNRTTRCDSVGDGGACCDSSAFHHTNALWVLSWYSTPGQVHHCFCSSTITHNHSHTTTAQDDGIDVPYHTLLGMWRAVHRLHAPHLCAHTPFPLFVVFLWRTHDACDVHAAR